MVLSLLCTFVAHITFLHVFFLPPLSFSLSLSCFLFLSLSLSLFLSLSLYLCPLFLSVVARHMSSDAFTKYSLLDQSYFFTPYLSIAHIKFTNYSPTIFYDYHPQSCLKNIFFALGPTVSSFSSGSTGTSSSRRLGAFSARKSAPWHLMVQAKSSLFLSAWTMKERKIPTWTNLRHFDHLKTFCPFPLLCIDLASSRKPPRNSSHHLQLQTLVDIPGFVWTRPNQRPLHKPRAHQTIQPGKQASSCQGNKPSTLPSRGRRVEVYGKRNLQPNNRYLNSSSARTGSISMLDGITLTTAELITLFDPDIWDQNLDGWSKWTARNPGLMAKAPNITQMIHLFPACKPPACYISLHRSSGGRTCGQGARAVVLETRSTTSQISAQELPRQRLHADNAHCSIALQVFISSNSCRLSNYPKSLKKTKSIVHAVHAHFLRALRHFLADLFLHVVRRFTFLLIWDLRIPQFLR